MIFLDLDASLLTRRYFWYRSESAEKASCRNTCARGCKLVPSCHTVSRTCLYPCCVLYSGDRRTRIHILAKVRRLGKKHKQLKQYVPLQLLFSFFFALLACSSYFSVWYGFLFPAVSHSTLNASTMAVQQSFGSDVTRNALSVNPDCREYNEKMNASQVLVFIRTGLPKVKKPW